MAKVNRRKLTEADVTFTVEVLEEDTQVRGNAVASDDDAADKALEDEIVSRLESGHVEAWCCLRVKAEWTAPECTVFEGLQHLGCCSFLPNDTIHKSTRDQIAESVDDYAMKSEALADLQREVDRADYREAGELVLEAIGGIPDKTLHSWVRDRSGFLPLAKAELVRRAIKR